MRLFACATCGRSAYFENSLCLHCRSGLGYDVARRDLVTVQVAGELDGGALQIVGDDGAPARFRCQTTELTRCNWLVDAPDALCASCALTQTRPADGDGDGLEDFAEAEAAKRRLVFSLHELGLPVTGFREQEGGLSFRLLSSDREAVTTGHADGVITLDLDEADDAHREMMRAQLDEPYRTLLGHFRHEVGHYYWPILVPDDAHLARCRELFGDERESYADALARHYETGPPTDWPQRHVSAYATMHPWEDWAETWAHYLHITDAAQTAAAHGLSTRLVARDDDTTAGHDGIRAVLAGWIPLTYALNGMTLSMGIAPLYPFVLAEAVIEKLAFVDDVVRAQREDRP